MSAEIELLNSKAAANSMINDGNEFFIAAGAAPSACWKVIPLRNLIQLCNQGTVVLSRQLEPRLMQLLCLLAKADGEVLTRDLLMNTLWPRVIVNENSLTRAVSELRKAFVLPEDAGFNTASTQESSALIETVPKRGYRLNASLLPEPSEFLSNRRLTNGRLTSGGMKSTTRLQSSATPTLSLRSYVSQYMARLPGLRYPAVAAAMVVSAALSSLWTFQLTAVQDPGQRTIVAESQSAPAKQTAAQQLEDRVVNDSPTLPEGLHWLESVHMESDNVPGLQASQISQSVLAPGGQMMAFVEDFPGQFQLRLRSLVSPDEAWTVFTSNSPITHLQWSPLDAGLLFTVEERDGIANIAIQDALLGSSQASARLSRLMLLDLETLQVRELYRRIVPAGDDHIGTVGSLT